MSKANVVLGLVAVLATAFALNPDEESFKKYIDTKMKNVGSTWFERKIVSNISTLVYKREDYKLFSVINVPENETNYLGIFGLWIPLPSSSRFSELKKDVEKDLKDAGKNIKNQYKSVEKDIKKKAEEIQDGLEKKGEEIQKAIKSE
ncbi:hypothetical protein H8356DRAFT_1649284 [Neocallimastix lanati (nom. inval.)]|jgi:gas vesicle protein|uniref:Uncharacterized protein n=1 Tax=Neocallimastix californiae TaxID=1754190 RepID=A0A1Y2CJA3_9FUNG|nr:hypothetical protein H8356DRAFT_1649284 [Neocallimastix sp. JGI-2020a]ORY47130.1 hypothetical protein LY90DRAFT_671221 [Neocallimastix californiae]|eukprot:ORY47130.1 hypothetical protein LY90DRAFT_671221 [Neocallimastix californiae]